MVVYRCFVNICWCLILLVLFAKYFSLVTKLELHVFPVRTLIDECIDILGNIKRILHVFFFSENCWDWQNFTGVPLPHCCMGLQDFCKKAALTESEILDLTAQMGLRHFKAKENEFAEGVQCSITCTAWLRGTSFYYLVKWKHWFWVG